MILNIGKNNVKLKREKQVEKRQFKFGIRKFSVGVASVLLGSLLFFGSVDVTPQGVSVGTGTTVNAAEGESLAQANSATIYSGRRTTYSTNPPIVNLYVNVRTMYGISTTYQVDKIDFEIAGVSDGNPVKYTQIINNLNNSYILP